MVIWTLKFELTHLWLVRLRNQTSLKTKISIKTEQKYFENIEIILNLFLLLAGWETNKLKEQFWKKLEKDLTEITAFLHGKAKLYLLKLDWNFKKGIFKWKLIEKSSNHNF